MPACGDLLERASSDVEHVDRPVLQLDEEIAEPVHDQHHRVARDEPRPAVQKRWPVQPGVVDGVLGNPVHGSRFFAVPTEGGNYKGWRRCASTPPIECASGAMRLSA